MIYLDNAATTKIRDEVLEAMMPYLTDNFGNPGSIYKIGRDAAAAVETARQQVADLIGAKSDQIIFTSGGSEANSLAFHGVKNYLEKIGKKCVLVSLIEHDSVIKAAESLTKDGFCVEFIPVKSDGVIDMKWLENRVQNGDVGLVSVMYENNEIGSVNPVRDVGRLCKSNGILFHTDCVQAAGVRYIDVEKHLNCDLLSISSHKIHGPKGVGALYVRDKSIMSPIIYGGGSQEYGLRGGTENTAGIVGFGKACTLVTDAVYRIYKISMLKHLFFDMLQSDPSGVSHIMHVNGASPEHPGKVLNIRFDGVDAETLLLALDAAGVCVSAGSACRSHESEPSRVLLGINVSPEEARQSIRISFSDMNTREEVIEAARILSECVMDLCIH